jgi:hypothetical protein
MNKSKLCCAYSVRPTLLTSSWPMSARCTRPPPSSLAPTHRVAARARRLWVGAGLLPRAAGRGPPPLRPATWHRMEPGPSPPPRLPRHPPPSFNSALGHHRAHSTTLPLSFPPAPPRRPPPPSSTVLQGATQTSADGWLPLPFPADQTSLATPASAPSSETIPDALLGVHRCRSRHHQEHRHPPPSPVPCHSSKLPPSPPCPAPPHCPP